MATHPVQSIVNGKPIFDVPVEQILAVLKFGGALKTLSPTEYISDQQRRWFKGVCLPALVKNDENGETLEWWDTEVKRRCGGLAYLKKEIFFMDNGQSIGRLTTKGVGVRNMTNFIEEILSKSIALGWPVTPPDAELRKH